MNAMMKVSAIIFDMDGLMLDTERIARMAWLRAMAELGYDFPDQVYRNIVGITVSDAERYLYEKFGRDFPFEEAYRRKQRYVRETIQDQGIPLKPGITELLEALDGKDPPMQDDMAKDIPAVENAVVTANRWLKAVASSSNGEIVRRNLEAAGLPAGSFDAIVGGDEVRKGKPAPDIYLLVSERLEVKPSSCLVLEDSNPGIKAAHAAGMIPVMIPDRFPPDEEAKALAYLILPDLHAVTRLILHV
jgi:beta-phosphoglucomutase-like phosphatase (HAD superfamily)